MASGETTRRETEGKETGGEEATAEGSAGEATVDAIGLNCPMPVLLARKALAKLPAGGRLTVIATDPLAGLDIPNLVREDGHALVSQRREGDRFIFEVAKGGAQP
ncbi:sulfurtransferase TusA family protein [Pseudoxanthobacter sp. M-2]|uniref:sulfurtransferase TusA family protein n=1 Tax=Pseudoxanthobacter sp. M-2 TaxID=3078754 RepID=UPI0038FC8EDE